jgi:hypothetical protein
MKKKKFLIIMLATILLVSSIVVYATEKTNELSITKEAKLQEYERLSDKSIADDKDIDWEFVVGSNDAKPMCPYCYWFAVTVCAAEARWIGEGSHKPLFQPRCYMDYFDSRGALMCPQCLEVLEQYGYHYCWEIHDSCSKGWYDICPMDVS